MLLVWVLFPSLLLTCMNTVFVCGIDWHLAMHLLAISEKIVPFWTMSAMNCTPSPNTHKHHFSFCSVSLFTSRLNVPVVSTICRGLSDHMHLRLHASGVSCTVVVSINAEQSLATRRADVQFAHKGFFGFTLQGSHTDMKVIKKKLTQDCMQHTQLFEGTAQKWPLQKVLGCTSFYRFIQTLTKSFVTVTE